MSMRDYAVNDYGLVLDEDMMKTIASQYCEDYTEEDYDEDPWAFDDELYCAGIVDYISEFSGEAIYINDNGIDDWRMTTPYNDDRIYYIPVSRIGTLFEAAYNNIEEMIDEFKSKIGKYFTDDFDYRKHICHIVGTYFG